MSHKFWIKEKVSKVYSLSEINHNILTFIFVRMARFLICGVEVKMGGKGIIYLPFSKGKLTLMWLEEQMKMDTKMFSFVMSKDSLTDYTALIFIRNMLIKVEFLIKSLRWRITTLMWFVGIIIFTFTLSDKIIKFIIPYYLKRNG